MGYSSFTNNITITAETPIKDVKITKGEVYKIDIHGNVAVLHTNFKDNRNWSVHFDVTDECRTWSSFMETSG